MKYSFDVLNEVFGFSTNKTVDEITKELEDRRALYKYFPEKE